MIATTRPFAPSVAPPSKQRGDPKPPSLRSAYRIGWGVARSEKRDTNNGTRGGTGGDAEDASNQPDHAEAERRMERRSDGIGNAPPGVSVEQSHAEEP